MLFNSEFRLTKKDWDYILQLKKGNLSPSEIDQALHDLFLPRMLALFNSDEILECEKEENLLSFDEYLENLQK